MIVRIAKYIRNNNRGERGLSKNINRKTIKLPKKVTLNIEKNSSKGERMYQFLYNPENQNNTTQ
jgi:hypothetical protein